MSVSRLNLFSFTGNIRILHISWIAFLISFMVWFNFAPLLSSIRETLGLTDQQIKMLMILNVALTIPARIVVGMLVDKYGPRIVYTVVLSISSLLCFGFAFSTTFEQMAIFRFALGFVGAGFVIGIRLISEWFPAKQMGLAEGIYGGWGNFGSAAATTGLMALIYAFIFYFSVRNTPKGSTYFKPRKTGAMEITSKGDFFLYFIMNIPMFAALAVLTWKLGPANLLMLDSITTNLIYAGLTALFVYQGYHIYKINKHVFEKPVPEMERYKFKQVAVLNLAYFVTFGSELAIVSMLPLFFMDTFNLSAVQAGLIAAIFAGLNLIMRPAGGWISDKFKRKLSLAIIMAGLCTGYILMSFIDSSWSIITAVIVTIISSVFVNAGNGAVFAIVPLIKRRMTGQIAGMTGAFGSVGAVTFLTVLSFVSPQIFFLTIAGAGIVTLITIVFFLEEPQGHMVETLPDGTVQMIEVS
jgi:NNP family nitrate/nitrite transporter-like MFS transporter